MRIALFIQLTEMQQAQLQLCRCGSQTSAHLLLYDKIVLLAAAQHANLHNASVVGRSRLSAGLWRQRFVIDHLAIASDSADLARGIPRDDRARRDVLRHDRSRTDDRSVSNPNRAEDHDVCAYLNPVAKNGCAAQPGRRQTQKAKSRCVTQDAVASQA